MFVPLMEDANYIISTDRVGLRQWQSSDIQPFAWMNMDLDVMRYFPYFFTPDESIAAVNRFSRSIDELGYGFFAAEHLDSGDFMGFVGLNQSDMPVDFCPCVEIGWRLSKSFWNQGYATEAAKACLEYAKTLHIDVVLSWTIINNQPSRRVMEKIGLDYIRTFDHPAIHRDHPMSVHVLYGIDLG